MSAPTLHPESTRPNRHGRLPSILTVFVTSALAVSPVKAQPPAAAPAAEWRRHATAIGVTRHGAPILAAPGSSRKLDDDRPRLLFVLSPMSDDAFAAVAKVLLESRFAGGEGPAVAVPAADLAGGHPPQGGFYDHPTQPEIRYLWRWIGMEAPDLVVEVAAGDGETWFVPDADLPHLRELAGHLPNVRPLPDSDGLVAQLVKGTPSGVGAVPAVRVVTSGAAYAANLDAALSQIRLPSSPAHDELRRRSARSAREIAGQLLDVYGKTLENVQYIPALALIGRLRQDTIDHGPGTPAAPIVLQATAPFVTGERSSTDGPGGSSVFPGHLVFGELAAITGDRRCADLVIAAADAAFTDTGTPREAMPMHNEMSDAVFMGCPILAQAARLSGDMKYAHACLRNLRFLEKLCLRHDGIYRHSPLDDAAWGRGNGFPALGLCWSLDELPESSSVRDDILRAHRAHLTALLPHQDADGCWHQVIDRPESYREFTATAMIAYALMRGIRAGRLDADTFGPPADRAWKAITLRIAADGSLVDVCTGTGKQKSLRDYYDRPAILGRDDRGGAMALLVATERQRYEATKSGSPPPR